MKIGILTYHRAINYGAFLQATALCSRLNQEPDIRAEIIDFNMKKAADNYSIAKWSLPKKIIRIKKYCFKKKLNTAFDRGYEKIKDMLSEESLCSDDLEAFRMFVKDRYDVIIAGSDEIWRPDSFRGFPTPYWLPGDLGCRKYSYAASARYDFSKLEEGKRVLLSQYLKDFSFISVRDQITYDGILGELGSDGKLLLSCDPSFLYDFPVERKGMKELFKKKGLNPKLLKKEKTVVVISESRVMKNAIRKELGGKVNLISLYNYGTGMISLPDVDPFEWMEFIANADFVITTLFHGVCFSIMNNVPFVAAGMGSRLDKIRELLKGTALEERLVPYPLENTSWTNLFESYCVPISNREIVKKGRDTFRVFLEKIREEG